MENLKISLCQINSIGGDIKHNCKRIINAIHTAKAGGAELIVFPELCISGYGADDFFLKSQFLEQCERAIIAIAEYSDESCLILIGYPEKVLDGVYSSVAILHSGKIIAKHRKTVIPHLELYTEYRYFIAGDSPTVVEFKGLKVSVIISEELLKKDAIAECDIICCCAAFPWSRDLSLEREQYLQYIAKSRKVPIVYVNNVGVSNSLVIEGCSSITNADGKTTVLLRHFEEDFLIVSLNEIASKPAIYRNSYDYVRELYWAIKAATKEFVSKTSQKKALILMDGSLNSKIALFIAMKALGKKQVAGLYIQSRWDSPHLKARSQKFMDDLGLKLYTWDLGNELIDGFISQGEQLMDARWKAETYDRFKAAVFVSVSELLDAWPLSSIDKSQVAVGIKDNIASFAVTGFMPLSDVYHSTIIELANFINQTSPRVIFSELLLDTARNVTLRRSFINDGSSTSLMLIDEILSLYIEKQKTVSQIIHMGYKETLVMSIIKRLYQEEINRVQVGFSPKLSNRSFQNDWLFPSVMNWDDLDLQDL